MVLYVISFLYKLYYAKEETMSLKKWAWDIFETTGNVEAFLTMKEAELQEKNKTFGKMEIGDIELNLKQTQINGDIDGANKN